MQQAGSQLVVSCMQDTDNVTLARAIKQYGVKIKQLWLSGYDQTLLNQYSSLMQGVYMNVTSSVPFEAANTARFGSTYKGMQDYIDAMKKYEPSYVYNGVAFQGWQSAALIAAGVKAAGSNVTQASVVAATNKITGFTAGGLSSPVDWTHGHKGYTLPSCNAFVQVSQLEVRAGVRQGQAGVRVRRGQRQEPRTGHPAEGNTRNVTGTADRSR